MSRRMRRYQNRQLKRNAKLATRNDRIGSVHDIFSFENVYHAGKCSCKNVRWKNSTQRFEAHLFSETAIQRRRILSGKWTPERYFHFTISERGKTRDIDAPKIQDRQIFKLYTRNVLLPLYTPQMIYNNGASLPGKGLAFSRRLLKQDLMRHYKRYGREGHIILIDFQKFFPSVSHEEILKRHKWLILNPELRRIGDIIVNSNHQDFGMPLGVEPSQAEMIAFPSALDNYIKCQLSIKRAGHYMDDYYVLVPPDQDPKRLLNLIVQKANDLKLTVNLQKTQIKPLTNPFRYCKAKYTLCDSGKIIVNCNKDTVKRDRRKLKSFYQKVKNGEMSYEDLRLAVSGMMAYLSRFDDHNKVLRLRRLFYALFGFSLERTENFRQT